MHGAAAPQSSEPLGTAAAVERSCLCTAGSVACPGRRVTMHSPPSRKAEADPAALDVGSRVFAAAPPALVNLPWRWSSYRHEDACCLRAGARLSSQGQDRHRGVATVHCHQSCLLSSRLCPSFLQALGHARLTPRPTSWVAPGVQNSIKFRAHVSSLSVRFRESLIGAAKTDTAKPVVFEPLHAPQHRRGVCCSTCFGSQYLGGNSPSLPLPEAQALASLYKAREPCKWGKPCSGTRKKGRAMWCHARVDCEFA